MPSDVKLVRCLLISPSDVQAEREAVSEAVSRWNGTVGDLSSVRLELVRWEQHAIPELGGRPQALINTRLADQCDLGVAIFWTRLGTPTGEFESGSVEEVERLVARGAPVLVYEKTAAIPSDLVRDADGLHELQRLRTQLGEFQTRGIIQRFADISELTQHVLLHLNVVASEITLHDRGLRSPQALQDASTTPDPPDIRVSIAAIVHPLADHLIQIEVQNHSNMPYFHSRFAFELEGDRQLVFIGDMSTGSMNTERRVEPGDSWSVFVSALTILSTAKGATPIRAFSRDKIGRKFASDPVETSNAFANARALAKHSNS